MACIIERDGKGNISLVNSVTRGTPSPLYARIKNNVESNPEAAALLWATTLTKPFTDFFGNWQAKAAAKQTDPKAAKKITVGKVNTHGEPQLVKRDGQWVFENNKKQHFPLLDDPSSKIAAQVKRVQASNAISRSGLRAIVEELSNLFPNVNVKMKSFPNDTRAGWVNEDQVVINLDRATKETPFHEFGHIFIRAIKQDNPELYEELTKDIEISSDVKIKNRQLKGEDLVEEELVTRLGARAAYKLGSKPPMKKFIEWIERLLSSILGLLRGSETQLRPGSLGMMRLDDIADIMLGNKSIFIDKDVFTNLHFNQETREDLILKLKEIGLQEGLRLKDDGSAYVVKGKELERLSEFANKNFRIKYKGEDMTVAQYRAVKEFEKNNLDIRTDYYTDEAENNTKLSFEQLVAKFERDGEGARVYGKIIHSFIELQLTKDENRRAEIEITLAKLKSEYEAIKGVSLRPEVLKEVKASLSRALFELGIKINLDKDKQSYAEGTEHIAAGEIMVSSDTLGIGTTIDGLFQNEIGELTILDWKTGDLLKGVNTSRILRFGGNWGLTDSKLNRAKLEVMLRAFMVKEKLGDVKFERLAVPRIAKNGHISIHNVDVQAFLGTIAKYLESVKSKEEMQALRSKKLLDHKEYIGTDSIVSFFHEELSGMTLAEKNDWAFNKLAAIRTKYSDAELNLPNNRYLKEQAANLGKLIIELNKEAGVQLEPTDESRKDVDMTMWERLTDNFSRVKNPFVQQFVKLFRKQNEKMHKRMRILRHENDKLFAPVWEEYLRHKGIPSVLNKLGTNSFMNKGVQTRELYAFLWKKVDIPGKSGYFLNNTNKYYDLITQTERAMSTAQIMYRDHIRSNMHKAYANVMDRKVINQNEKEIETYKYLGMNNRLEDDFAPRIPQKLSDVMETGFFPIQAMAQHIYRKNLTSYIESTHLKIGAEYEGGVKLKYVIPEDSEVIANELHSFNMQEAYLSFMNNMIRKEEMDDMYHLGHGIRSYMDMKIDADKNPLYKNTVAFLEDQILLQVMDERFRDDDVKNTKAIQIDPDHILVRAGLMSPGQKEINWAKAVYLLKGGTTAIAMGFKAASGTANGVMIFSFNALEAIKNEMMLFAGEDESTVDVRFADLLKFHKSYFSDYLMNTWKGTPDNSKVWGMAKQLRYIADNFDYKVDPSDLLGAKNSIWNTGHMYIFHTMWENYGSLQTMYMQLKSIKTPDGKSIWDHYQKNEANGEWEYTGPDRGRVKQPDGTFKTLRGLEPEEIAHLKKNHERVHGSYRSEEAMAIQLQLWGQFVLQFKRFLPVMINNLGSARHMSNALGDWVPQRDKNGRLIQNEGLTVYEWQNRVQLGRLSLFASVAGAYLGRNSDKFKKGYVRDLYVWDNLSTEDKKQFFHVLATISAMIVLGLMAAAIPDEEENKYWAKRFKRLAQEDITQGANPIDLLRFAEKPIPAATKSLRLLEGASQWLSEGILQGELTREGNVKGKLPTLSNLPILSGIRQMEMIFEEYNETVNTDFLDFER